MTFLNSWQFIDFFMINIAVRNTMYLVVWMYMLMLWIANDGNASNISREKAFLWFILWQEPFDCEVNYLYYVLLGTKCTAKGYIYNMEVQIHNDVTIIDWCNFIWGVYGEDLEHYLLEIYDFCDSIIVEIDESKNSIANTTLEYVLRPWHWIFSGTAWVTISQLLRDRSCCLHSRNSWG